MAENVVVTINVKDLGSAKVQQFAKNTQSALSTVTSGVKTTNGVFSTFASTLAKNIANAFSVLPAYAAVGAAVGGLTAAIGTAITDVVDFDRNLRNVASISPDVAKNFDSIRKQLIALDPALGSTAELADALYETYSSGISIGRSVAENIKFTADAAKFAQAAAIGQAQAVKTLSATLQAFGADISRASQFADIFQNTVNIGAFRSEELAGSLGRVTPIASQLGLSFSETSAAIATLSQAGLGAAESITGLRQILNNALQNVDEFDAAGIDLIGTLRGKDGLVSLFQQLKEATNGNEVALRRFIPNIRGANAASALQGNLLQKLIDITASYGKEVGLVDKAFEEQQLSISAGFKRLTASFDRAAQSLTGTDLNKLIGTSLGDIGKSVEDATTSFVGFTSTLDEWIKEAERAYGISLRLGDGQESFAKSAAESIAPVNSVANAYRILSTFIPTLASGIGDLSGSLKLSTEEFKKYGSALRGGGLAAQEAYNAILKARNDSVQAALAQAEADKKDIGVLQELTTVVDKSGGAFDKQGKAATNATAALDGLGLTAAETVTKQEQLRANLTKVIEGVDQFDSKLGTLVENVVKTSELHGEAADRVSELAQNYGKSINVLETWRQALRGAGATTEELSGKVDFTAESVARMAEQSGLSVHQVSALVTQFKIAEINAETYGKQLRTTGADVSGFTEQTIQLRATMDRLQEPTIKFAAALKSLTGITLSKLNQEVGNTVSAIKFLAQEGTTDTRLLVEETDKLADSYRKVGQEVPADLKALQDSLRKTERETRTVAEAFESLNGSRFDQVANGIEDLRVNLMKLGGQASLSGTALFDSVEELAQKARALYGEQIPDAIRQTIAAQSSLALSTTTVNQAFEKLNGSTIEGLTRSVRQSLQEIEVLFNSGNIGSVQMTEALKGIREQFNLLGPEGQAALEPILNSLERSIPLAQGFTDSLQQLGATTKDDLARNAELAGEAFKKLVASGEVSGRELVRVYQEEVAPAYEEATMRIPNSVQNALVRAQAIGSVEASKAGISIGESLGTAIADTTENVVTNRIGQVIQTIADRFQSELRNVSDVFDQIAPGTTKPIPTVRFGNTLEDLKQNEADLQRLLRGTTGATASAASSRQQLNKALTEVRRRIAEIEAANKAAEDQSNSFTSSSASGLNSVASQANNVATSFGRVSNSILTAGENLQSFASTAGSLSNIDFNPFTSSTPDTGGTDTSLTTGIGSGEPSGGQTYLTTSGTQTGNLFGRFQSGVQFAQQGQLAKLEAGEAIVPRDIARQLRSLDFSSLRGLNPGGALFGAVTSGAPISRGGAHFVPGTGFVGSIVIGRRSPGSSLSQSGFQYVPGFGYVPNANIASAVGNVDQVSGENSQITMQRKIIPLVRGAITRRDLTRDISGATALTNKGQPSTGGS